MTFEDWLAKVDRIVSAKCGVGIDDLSDLDYRGAFEDEVSPREMAADVFENEGVNW